MGISESNCVSICARIIWSWLKQCVCVGSEDGIIPAGCASGYMGRRRTDLMPTIPIRDSSSLSKRPFTKSPGRTYSLSRLDQLSKPRKTRVASDLPSVSEAPTSKSLSASPSSMSRSMTHLAVSGALLNKSNSRSMHVLSIAPVPLIRTNRALQLRRSQQTQDTCATQGKTYPHLHLHSSQLLFTINFLTNINTYLSNYCFSLNC